MNRLPRHGAARPLAAARRPPGDRRDATRVSALVRRESTRPWQFVALALAWSWFWWTPVALGVAARSAAWTVALVSLGSLGPPLAALAVLAGAEPRAARREYFARLVDVRSAGAAWWGVALLLPAAIALAAGLTEALLAGTPPPGIWLGRAAATPGRFALLAVVALLFGPVPDEMAWRGYALDRLQRSHAALGAAAIVGLATLVWQMPLLAIPGMSQYRVVASAPRALLFGVELLSQSVLLAWLYNSAARSTLVAVVFHFAANLTSEALVLPGRAGYYRAAWTAAAAVAVVLRAGPRTLRGWPARWWPGGARPSHHPLQAATSTVAPAPTLTLITEDTPCPPPRRDRRRPR